MTILYKNKTLSERSTKKDVIRLRPVSSQIKVLGMNMKDIHMHEDIYCHNIVRFFPCESGYTKLHLNRKRSPKQHKGGAWLRRERTGTDCERETSEYLGAETVHDAPAIGLTFYCILFHINCSALGKRTASFLLEIFLPIDSRKLPWIFLMYFA